MNLVILIGTGQLGFPWTKVRGSIRFLGESYLPRADTALAIAKLCVSFASQSAFPSPESCELLDVGGIPGAGRQDFEVSNFDGLHRHGATPRYRPAKPTPPAGVVFLTAFGMIDSSFGLLKPLSRGTPR